jgi:hypothetical protein
MTYIGWSGVLATVSALSVIVFDKAKTSKRLLFLQGGLEAASETLTKRVGSVPCPA